MRRGLIALVAIVAGTALLATTALAFGVGTGFTATTYSSTYPLDAGGRGPRATAWDGNVLWTADHANDGLYRADAGGTPGPGTHVAPALFATVTGGLNGLAVGQDGRLYATLVDVQRVVEIDKTTFATRTLATGIAPRSLATDPLTGDLIVTGDAFIWRIANPASATPTTTIYATPPGNTGTRAIGIGPDGTIFVVNIAGQLYLVDSTATAASHGGVATVNPVGAPVAGIVGVSVVTNGVDSVPQFLMLTTSTGSIYKSSISGASGDLLLVVDGAGTGDQMSVGPDRCVYASMGAAVLRIADASGGCGLAAAGLMPPALAIANTTGQDAHVNGPDVTINAHLANAATPGGHLVTFQVTGVNPFTQAVTTDATGNASLHYTSAVEGTDTVVAIATVDGFPLTSNTITITWLPEPDLVPPTIGFHYTVPAHGTGVSFTCDQTVNSATPFPPGVQPNVRCGWFTEAPTLYFDVVPHGTSGIGATTDCGPYTLVGQPGPQGQARTCQAQNGSGLASASLTVIIDAVLSPPTVVATATANGSAYAAGALTRWPVTVHFDCSASPIQQGLACPADETFSGTGVHSAIATATDVAGQSTTVQFAPIDIDATPPTIAVASGPYVFGSWTNADVRLVFTCGDNRGVASCPAPQTVTASAPGVTVIVTDLAGNSTPLTTGAISIDRTPPAISAAATTADGHAYAAGSPTNQNVTVHFTCTTDGAPIVSCPPDAVFTAAGSAMATGSASDAAGNTAPASFGPVVIDRTPPTISATATLGGLAYDGSWTRGPVLVHFTCADELRLASCPPDQSVATDRDAPVSGTAQDAAGNAATATTVAIRVDRTPPVTVATLGGQLSAPGIYLFTVNVALVSTDAGSGVAGIHYVVNGIAHDTSGATVSLVLNTEGPHTVVFHAVDRAGNGETDQMVSFSIIFRQHTALAITSAAFLATGAPVVVRLTNTDAGGAPVAGETVSATANGVTRTGVTDVTGTARVDLGLPSGAYALTATYAGTPRYFPSADEQALVVYAPTRFVVWGPNAVVGGGVQFWGDDWAKQIDDKTARRTLDKFKGFAETAGDDHWSARGGDTVKPPRTIPRYIAVIVTERVARSRETVTGDVAGIAVLRVSGAGDDGPSGVTSRLGERAFGTVLAVVH